MTKAPSWQDGLGGALALLADRLTGAQRAQLLGRLPVLESWSKGSEGWYPTRWPLTFDAALATMAARSVDDPGLERMLERLDRRAGHGELLALQRAHVEELSRGESSPAAYNLAAVYLATAGGVPYRALRDGLATNAATAARALLADALDTGALDAETIVQTVRSWAPRPSVGCTPSRGDVVTGVWPNFAIVLDGTRDAELPSQIAAACVGNESTEGLLAVLRRHRSLRGAGVIACARHDGREDDDTLVACWGSVRGWRSGRPTHEAFDDDASAARVAPDVTLALSVDVADDVMRACLSSDRAPATLAQRAVPPPRTAGMAELFRGAAPSSPPAPGAVAFLRPSAPPKPFLPADPTSTELRCASIRAHVEACLAGSVALRATVSVGAATDETDGTYRRVPSIDVVVVRDDAPGASDESAAARRVEARLEQDPELWPWSVRGEYGK